MGQLVFQAALGGQVNLVGPNTASTFNLNVPAASDTLVARATTDTLTNKTLTSPVISGGTIDNAVIGGTTAVAGSFTTVTAGTSVTTPFVTSAAATNLLLKSAGTTAVTIDTSQNVGVGVTPSAWGGTSKALQLPAGSLESRGSTITTAQNAYYNGTNWIYSSTAVATLLAQTGGAHYFYTAPSGTAGNAISFTQAMTLDASGRLLVGTTSGSGATMLSVNQPAASTDAKTIVSTTTGTNAAFTAFVNTTVTTVGTENSTGGSLVVGSSAYSTVIANNGAYPISFGTNNTERMRITSGGDFLVGTSTGTTSGGYYFAVGSSSSFDTGHATGVASGTTFQRYTYAGSVIGSISQSGTTAVLYNLTSDARLKTNIVDAPLGNIDDVKVRSFDWKSDNSHVEYGFIAQELVEVAPYAVHQPQDPEEMMAVDYSKLVPMMIKEIQDLKQRIKTLENK